MFLAFSEPLQSRYLDLLEIQQGGQWQVGGRQGANSMGSSSRGSSAFFSVCKHLLHISPRSRAVLQGSALSCGTAAVYTIPSIPPPPTHLISRPSLRFPLSLLFPFFFPIPVLFLPVFHVLLSISPRPCLRGAIRSQHFCMNHKWCIATTCWYPCEIIDHPELWSDKREPRDGVWRWCLKLASSCCSIVRQIKRTFRHLCDVDRCSVLNFRISRFASSHQQASVSS